VDLIPVKMPMLMSGYIQAVVQPPDPVSADGRWVPHDQRVNVAGHVIRGGLFYVGRYLCGVTGQTEPALINSDLPVVWDGRSPSVDDLGSSLAYHLLSPSARGAYLSWLAGGRRTDVPAGFVLLFCFGLERRVLHEAANPPSVPAELPTIAAEVRRLSDRYGRETPELSGPLERLLDLLVVLAAPRGAPTVGPGPAGPHSAGPHSAGPHSAGPRSAGPSSAPAGQTSPMALRVALARFATSGTPVPVDWAREWARHHPLLVPHGAQAQCPEEFDRLFTLRYRHTFGVGLVSPDDLPGLRIRYEPANPGLSATLVCREDLPDVLAEPRSGRALRALTDEIAGALDPYRRLVARFPDSRGSLVATTVLPPDLLDSDRGRFGALRVWTEARFDGRTLAVVDGAEFAAFWSTASPGRMARDEATAFIGVLALLGLGVEPDVRFGAPALGPGPVVLFRSGAPVWQRPAGASGRAGSGAAEADRPGPGFAAAAIIARCAAATVTAAGPVAPHSDAWVRALDTVADLATACRIPAAERPRLAARLGWLLTTGVTVDRLPRQVTRLVTAERELAGSWLISVAAATEPAFPPATVAALTRLYRILGLELDLLFHRLHAFSVAGPTRAAWSERAARPMRTIAPRVGDVSDGPVVVKTADPHHAGFALPWSATCDAGASPTDAEARPGDETIGGEVRLDPAVISRKIDESAAVATLLATIFDADADADPMAAGQTPVAAVDGAAAIAGLDSAHSGLLRALTERPSWTRDEFTALAGAHGVLPDGALDVLNEAAIDAAGEPVVPDGATLAIDHDVLQELLR
jgi:hypothetical protein